MREAKKVGTLLLDVAGCLSCSRDSGSMQFLLIFLALSDSFCGPRENMPGARGLVGEAGLAPGEQAVWLQLDATDAVSA